MKNINEKEIKEIFIGIKNNNEVSFNKLYEKYHNLIYGISFSILKNREDSEDVMQNVFSKIYELDKDKLPTNNEFSWIYTVTKNEAISHLRKKNIEIGIDEIYEAESKEDEISKIIDKEKYNKIISRLDKKEKEIVSLKILSDLSFKEISKLLKEPTNTIKWRYYKAMHTLKLFLGSISLFIVAFTLGIRNIIQKTRTKSLPEQMEHDVEQTKNESIVYEEDKNLRTEETKKTQDTINNIINENMSQSKENIIVNQATEEIDYANIGIIGVSSIFLIIAIGTLISFIKHKRNQKKKSSK